VKTTASSQLTPLQLFHSHLPAPSGRRSGWLPL